MASHRRCWELALGITVQLAAAAAVAQPVDDNINPDRPGLADRSSVVGAGRIQVETGLQRDNRTSNGTQPRTLFVPRCCASDWTTTLSSASIATPTPG